MMNETENDRIRQLCQLIVAEQDHYKFIELVEELDRMLSAKDQHSKGDQLSP